MEKVFYETDANNNCTKICEFKEDDVDIYVGSLLCKQCKQNLSYEAEEKWIKCEIYSVFLEATKLEEENEQLKKRVEHLEKQISNGIA